MSVTITAPVKGFTGTSYLGPTVLTFKDGTAEVDGDLSEGQRLYLEQQGYGINGAASEPAPAPEPADPRDLVGQEQVGTPLRDAAVDPQPGDFLAPTNAGQANPHGPDVVSPGIHALQDVRPVKPGDVHVDDTSVQNDAETDHAAAATDGTPIVAGGVVQPAGNASTEAWHEYAIAAGKTPEELDGLGRDAIRDLFA